MIVEKRETISINVKYSTILPTFFHSCFQLPIFFSFPAEFYPYFWLSFGFHKRWLQRLYRSPQQRVKANMALLTYFCLRKCLHWKSLYFMSIIGLLWYITVSCLVKSSHVFLQCYRMAVRTLITPHGWEVSVLHAVNLCHLQLQRAARENKFQNLFIYCCKVRVFFILWSNDLP